MDGILIEYLIGLYLVGISLDKPRENLYKMIGGLVLIVLAVLGVSPVK